MDSGGNRQVDSGGNQDQATDQEKLNSQDDDVIGPQGLKDNSLPNLLTPAQLPEPQPNITTAPSLQAPPVQAPSPQAPSVQAPPAQALSAQALSAQAPSAQAPLASPSLTKAKEPRQPSLYKPPQPAQQSLPAATAPTPSPANAPTLPNLPPAQYPYPSTANTDPNMQPHMDQPMAHITSICQPKASFDLPFAAQSSAVAWEKWSQGVYTTFFTDRRYRQQY